MEATDIGIGASDIELLMRDNVNKAINMELLLQSY